MQGTQEKAQFTLSNLSTAKKVIPIYYQNGDWWYTDIKLPDLVLTNLGPDPLDIVGLSMIGLAQGQERIRLTVDQGFLASILQVTHQIVNKQLKSPSVWSDYNLGMLFGKVSRWPETLDDLPLPSGASACLRLQDLFRFHYAGPEKIDRVLCEVVGASGGKQQALTQAVSLTPYTCRGEYRFPVRGPAVLTGMPFNQVMGHRIANSQEFAFDVVDLRPDGAGGFSPSAPPESEHVKDYYFFEREVLAVGDGVVVASGNQWPNRFCENPLINPDDRIIEQTQELLDQGVDFTHAILGNFAIIDHQNGEFSVYAHMSEKTVTVQPGDRVKGGQVIGKVGNTSNSDYPHLHFHLMDAPDFMTANGLPVRFKDLPDGQPGHWDFSRSSTLLYSDYLFVNIPD